MYRRLPVNFISVTEASNVDLVCTTLTTFYHMHHYNYAATGDMVILIELVMLMHV